MKIIDWLKLPEAKKSIAIFCALVIGIWFYFSPGTLYVSLMTTALLWIFGLSIEDRNQRKIVINICILAISLRFIFCIFNYYFSWARGIGTDFIPDACGYSVSGQYIAEVITNKPMPHIVGYESAWLDLLRTNYRGSIPMDYGMDAFARYIGWIYSIFGYAPITVKFINSFLSLFTGILLFLLVKDFFSIKVAKITLILSLFWPSIFLWSVGGNKDPIVLFLITLFVFVFTKFRKYVSIFDLLLILGILLIRNYNINALLFMVIIVHGIIKKFFRKCSISYILITSVSILILKITTECILSLRWYFFIPLAVTSLSSVISSLNKKQVKFLLLIIFLLSLSLTFYVSKNNVDFRKYFTQAFDSQRNQLYAANSAYRVYPDKYYQEKYNDSNDILNITPFEFIISYFRGFTYVLFSPFPWFFHNKIQFFACFQMIIYYLLFPFLFLGFLVSLRFRWREVLPIITFLLITSSIYALFQGNVGTLFRHRGILMNFQFIFIAVGIGKLLGYIRYPQVA